MVTKLRHGGVRLTLKAVRGWPEARSVAWLLGVTLLAGAVACASSGGGEAGHTPTTQGGDDAVASTSETASVIAGETSVAEASADTASVRTASAETAHGDAQGAETAPGEAAGADETGGESTDAPVREETISLEALFALDGSRSTSFGGPNDGRLEGAVPLPLEGPGFVSNPRRPNPGGYFGTVEMVQQLVRAAGVVHAELGGTMAFNDLSLEEGGPIPHHGSHTGGRDVDALFFYTDPAGNPVPSKGIPIDPRGRGWDFGDLGDPADDIPVRLDVPRTWKFVEALVTDEHSTVQRIFVVEHVREMLLAHARRAHAPRAAIERFDEMTCQPGVPHDDHLHVRFFCTPEDIGAGQCADMYPIYPWWRRRLREADVAPIPATNGRRSRQERRARAQAAPTVSRAEARESAGPMHARVRQFLEEREAWSERPHPGRPYCR